MSTLNSKKREGLNKVFRVFIGSDYFKHSIEFFKKYVCKICNTMLKVENTPVHPEQYCFSTGEKRVFRGTYHFCFGGF